MPTDSIVIGSITYAQKARRALQESGIRARIRKFDPKPGQGCTYGLEFPSGHMLAVAAVLRPLHIRYEVNGT